MTPTWAPGGGADDLMPPAALSEECGCVLFLVSLPCLVYGLRLFFRSAHLGRAWQSQSDYLHEHPVFVLLLGLGLVAGAAVALAVCLESATGAGRRKSKREKTKLR